jgi:hypothetical protein
VAWKFGVGVDERLHERAAGVVARHRGVRQGQPLDQFRDHARDARRRQVGARVRRVPVCPEGERRDDAAVVGREVGRHGVPQG